MICLREIPVNWQWDICNFNQKKHLVAKGTSSNNVKIYLWVLHPIFSMSVTIVLRWTLLSSSAKRDKPGIGRYLISVYIVLYEVVFQHFYFIWKFLKSDNRKNGMVYHKIKLVLSIFTFISIVFFFIFGYFIWSSSYTKQTTSPQASIFSYIDTKNRVWEIANYEWTSSFTVILCTWE